MTLYEKILTFDALSMAQFIYTLINDTELKMLHTLHASGIQASLVHAGEEARILENLAMLMQEVDDDT